jgi:hypothetical protein
MWMQECNYLNNQDHTSQAWGLLLAEKLKLLHALKM